jgi:hypothetical protein
MRRVWAILLPLLMAGCSASLLEQIDEPAALPKPCSEATKLFDTFTMRLTKAAWSSARPDEAAVLEVDLAFANDKSWPVALSNSGMGVLYDVEFRLHGAGGIFAPKQTTGIALTRAPQAFQEPPRRAIFAPPVEVKRDRPADNVRDVNFRIKPGAPEEAKLVFEVPRQAYLLTVERKFGNKSSAGRNSHHIAGCKISG